MWEGEGYRLSDWRAQIAYEGEKGFGDLVLIFERSKFAAFYIYDAAVCESM
jgi:hypothetical protein